MKVSHFFVQQKLNVAWDLMLVRIRRMYSASTVRPAKGTDIFVFDGASGKNCYKFNVAPIVLVLPERAGKPKPKLHIVIEGKLELFVQDKNNIYTNGFGTRVGYFRTDGETVEHIYGAHYDFDEALAHPVFHAHIASQIGLLDAINTHLHIGWTRDSTEDKVSPLLSNVRTPTAQMDFFSAVAQICADHLVYEASSEDVQTAFRELCASTNIFVGAAYCKPYLNSGTAPMCYRAPHWYGAV